MSLITIAQTLYNEAADKGVVTLDDSLLGGGNAFSSLVATALLRAEGNILLTAKPGDIPQNPTGNSFNFPATLPAVIADSFLQLTGNTVTVTIFQTTDGVIQLELAVALTNWVFSDSFPELLGWPFDMMPFSDSQFIFAYGNIDITPVLPEGLNFAGNFSLTGILAPLAQLFNLFNSNDVQPGSLSGLITQTENGPEFNIKGPILNAPVLDLEALTVSNPYLCLNMRYETDENQEIEDWGEIILETTTTIENANNEGDAVTASFILNYSSGADTNNNVSLSLIIAPAPGTLSTSLANIGSLMAGQTWDSFFATEPASILLPYLQEFGLQSYGVSINLQNLDVICSNMVVGTLKPWDIIPGKLSMDNFSVTWQLLNPFAAYCSNNILLNGLLTLYGQNGDEIHFAGEILLPELKLSMTLYADKELTAAEWLQTLVSAFGGGNIPAGITKALEHFSMEVMSLSMDVPAKHLSFNLTGAITVGDNQVDFSVILDLQVADKLLYDISVAFGLDGYTVSGNISNEGTDNDVVINCQWANETNPITTQIIADALGFDNLSIPDALLLDLTSIELSYNITKNLFAIGATSEEYGSADILVFKLQSQDSYTFFAGLNLTSPISLSNIPLIGAKLSAIETVQVENIQVLVTSAMLTKEEADELNGIINNMPGGDSLPQLPAQGMASTVDISMTINVGGYIIPLSTGLGGATDSSAPPDQTSVTGNPSGNSNAPVSTTPANQANGTFWLNVQKAVGPLMFRRIGVRYADPVLWFLLDASFEAGGLTIDLDGAGVGSPLNSFKPSFTISGLGLDFRTAGFELGGTLIKVTPAANVEWQYAGGIVARLEGLSLSALGSYANIYTNDDHTATMPSMFLFAQVTGSLGGVPAFFVTGLSAGFGYNSSLRIPDMNQVQDFPLVAGASDSSKIGGKNATPEEALNVLMGLNGGVAWVSDQLGEYWLAAGLQFNSFELVSTNALLVAQFGTHFQFALLGLSKASFPIKSPKTYGYVELQLEVLVDPTVGFVGLTAVLSANSYVLDPACKLTGGFAFYAWFSPNEHAGDFVITLGGYHPSFDVPSWYPEVPAVGFSWAMDSTISLTGTAYFALTPAAVMAGGELDATYHDGDLRAWFKAWANVLIYWNPFHFDVAIGITVGASYRVNLLFTHCTMEASLGATLHIWGPETGGTVRVNWTVISFTISFGANATGNPGPISWSAFTDQLPEGNNVIRVMPADGLAANGNSDMSATNVSWQVRPGGFTFNVISSVPNSLLTLNGDSDNPLAKGDLINIRAMQDNRKNGNGKQGKNLQSILNLIVKKNGEPIDTLDSSSTWNISARVENIPKAMWGVGPQDQMPEGTDQLLEDQLTGFIVSSPSTVQGYTPGLIDANTNLTDLVLASGELPINTSTPVGTSPQEDANTISIISGEIASATVSTSRNALYNDLQNLGIDPITNDDMQTYAADATSIFTAVPMILKTTINA